MVEIDAYRYCHRSDGSVVKNLGKIDIPDACKKRFDEISQKFAAIITCELLRTGEIVWYIEHEPSQYTLATVITENKPDAKKYHLEMMQKLFDRLPNDKEIKKQLKKEAKWQSKISRIKTPSNS